MHHRARNEPAIPETPEVTVEGVHANLELQGHHPDWHLLLVPTRSPCPNTMDHLTPATAVSLSAAPARLNRVPFAEIDGSCG